jgi:hypothetical protein
VSDSDPYREKAITIIIEIHKATFGVSIAFLAGYLALKAKDFQQHWWILDYGVITFFPLAAMFSIIGLYLMISPLRQGDDPLDNLRVEIFCGCALVAFILGVVSGSSSIIWRALATSG